MTVCAPCPQNEMERLRALHSYRILDTPQESAFDDLTRAVAAQLRMPVSLISLVDANRQWFKSHFGIETRSTPRDIAFCSHTILERDPLIVPNAQRDVRFADNPLVTNAPHVRFYAGVPLLTPDDYAIGTVCVIDRVPRLFSATQVDTLQTFAGQVMQQLERHRAEQEQARQQAVLPAPGRAATGTRFCRRVLGWCRHVLRWLRHADPYHYTPEVVNEYQQSLLNTLARYNLHDPAQQVMALYACIPILFTIREPATQVQFARDLVELYPQHHERANEFMTAIMEQVNSYGRGGDPALPPSVLSHKGASGV